MASVVDAASVAWLRSADGSRIGYARCGRGPALVLVHGATADRGRWVSVIDALAARFTVYLMDRRGRGLSLDEVGPYAIDREAEDVQAVVAEAAHGQGGPVFLLGHSYGGLCALLAARRALPVSRLLVYEPAFAVPGAAPVDSAVLAEIERLIAAGRRDEALALFFVRLIGTTETLVAQLRQTPAWAARLAALPALPREIRAALAGPPAGLSAIAMPVRVLVGSASPVWLQAAAAAVPSLVPQADRVELPGQGHAAMDTAPALFVAEVQRFFLDGAETESGACGR